VGGEGRGVMCVFGGAGRGAGWWPGGGGGFCVEFTINLSDAIIIP
jgi:hypothetical protein